MTDNIEEVRTRLKDEADSLRGVSQLSIDLDALLAHDRQTEAERDEAQADRDEYRDLLHDLVRLEHESWALNGGGPGFLARWEKAMRLATEKFTP